MVMTRNTKRIEVECVRSMYLFLNDTLMLAADDSDSIWLTKQHILNTLVVVGVYYTITRNLYSGDDGCMHEVTEISAHK